VDSISLFEVVFIALGLAFDAFAVCLGVGAARLAQSARPIFRLAFHFGLFQFLMPVLGWLAGTSVESWIIAWDHWVAFGLLSVIGGRMVVAGTKTENDSYPSDPSRGSQLVLLSVATSIDAFAVGISLAMLRINIFYPSVVIGGITGMLSWIGLIIGHHLGQRFGKGMEILGGVILIGIGFKVLLSHL